MQPITTISWVSPYHSVYAPGTTEEWIVELTNDVLAKLFIAASVES